MTRPARVLVVHHDPGVPVLCEGVALFGYEVTPASGGHDALAPFRRRPLRSGARGSPHAGDERLAAGGGDPSSLVGAGHPDYRIGNADLERAHAKQVLLLHEPVTLAVLKGAVEQALRGRPNASPGPSGREAKRRQPRTQTREQWSLRGEGAAVFAAPLVQPACGSADRGAKQGPARRPVVCTRRKRQ